jgi:hypothetical protein
MAMISLRDWTGRAVHKSFRPILHRCLVNKLAKAVLCISGGLIQMSIDALELKLESTNIRFLQQRAEYIWQQLFVSNFKNTAACTHDDHFHLIYVSKSYFLVVGKLFP